LGSLATSFCARESAPADLKDYSKSQICHYLRAYPAAIKILGVLHRGDFHPYEIKRRLKNALVECYTDVDVGTLYLCRAATGQIGGYRAKSEAEVTRGGERTIYQITSQGQRRFQQLLLERFQEKGTVAQTIIPFCSFSISPICQLLLNS
jgi:DNA-binding PadR family transcriptional regulator